MHNKIIDRIQQVRSKNNVNWMNLLRLAIKENPKDSIDILSAIYESDIEISELVKLLKNFREIEKNLKIELANLKDSDIILHWRNEKLSRSFSKNSKKINVKVHNDWFNNFLNNKRSFLYIFRIESIDLGMIRLDHLKENDFLVSIIVDPKYRGLGLGKLFLSKIIKKNKKHIIFAEIKKNNISSINLFKSLGFKKIKKGKEFETYKK